MPPDDELLDDSAYEADDGAVAEEEEAVEYDEDTAALIQAAREEERAKAQTEIDTFKGQYGRRFGKAREALAAQGLEIAEDGTPLVRDPLAAASWFKQNVIPLAIGEGVAQREEAEEPLDLYDAGKLEQQVNRRIERGITSGVEKALAPLMERLDGLTGFMGAQATGGVVERVRGVLADGGLGALADDPAFQEQFQAAVRDGVKQHGPQLAHDEGYLAGIAGAIALSPGLAESRRAAVAGRAAPNDPRARIANAQRNSLRQITPSNGQAAADYGEEDLMGAQLLGISVQEYRRLGDDQSVDETLARRRKSNGAAKR